MTQVAKPSPEDIILDLALGEAPMAGRQLSEVNARSVPSPASRRPPLQEIRTVHQSMARMFASGKSAREVALATGYSAGYVSMLRDDPAFAELMATYKGMAEIEFLENSKLRAQLNRTALEVAQQRLTEEPEKIANKDLFSLIKETSEAPLPGAGVSPPAPTKIEVNFFSRTPGRALSQPEPALIEAEVNHE